MTVLVEPEVEQQHVSRVLIVDDTEDARTLLRIKLGSQGPYAVIGEAEDGTDAVEQAARLQPDLVILDVAMPGMDGLEALPLIRRVAPAARIVVLSVFQPGELADRAIEAGADRYVVKGGTMRDLMAVLDSVLGGR